MTTGFLVSNCFIVTTLSALVALSNTVLADVTIKGEINDIFTLGSQKTGASELSGITHAGGQQYYVVGDSGTKAYPLTIQIDPLSGTSPFTDLERRGVVDIATLSKGRLLVLERELAGTIPAFRYAIYLVEIAQATDASNITHLKTSEEWTATQKSLLWEKSVGPQHNFEGMTIGESLGSGRYSLMLVSDNGGGLSQAIWSLVLCSLP